MDTHEQGARDLPLRHPQQLLQRGIRGDRRLSQGTYAHHASLASADAASRNVRTSLAKHRQEVLRRVVNVPKEKAMVQQAVHRMAIELPYSPTSLFGAALR